MQDSSEKSLLLSSPSSLELEDLIKNLDEDERDEAERNKATGFNIFMAAKTKYKKDSKSSEFSLF